MDVKKCSKCGVIKPASAFARRNDRKCGLQSRCKECDKKIKNAYRQTEKYRTTYEAYKEKARISGLKYARKNREKLNQYNREYRKSERGKKRAKEYREQNRERLRINQRHYVENNRDRVRNQMDAYIKSDKGRETRRKYAREYLKNKMKNPSNKIYRAFSGYIYHALKKKGNTKNNKRWVDIVGYTISELMLHLENQFVDGMNWENYGKWEVDHIIPVSKFNFKRAEDIDFQRCRALINLQLLWKEDNIKKSDKLINDFQPCLSL